MRCLVAVIAFAYMVYGKMDSDDFEDSGDRDLDESSEHLGPVVTQGYRHPYAATILKNSTYECSAVILNTYWLITLSKCFNPEYTSSYLNQKKLHNYAVRVGSTYNMKSGSLYQIKMLINNFDLKVSAVKLETPLVFGSRVQAVQLPMPDEEVTLGYLASIVAWTPDGHMRVVNVPVIEASICDDSTKLLPGHYICVGGVQDPNRNFCRKDNGGAVIQNNTLIALATFYQTCALYTRAHAFPKVSSFARWLDSVIWDENNRPTTTGVPSSATTKQQEPVSEPSTEPNPYYVDPSKFMLTLPYDTINLPLVPAEDNSVLPRISLYESYLQDLARAKTTTTQDPNAIDKERAEWLKKYGKAIMMMPASYMAKKYDEFEY